MSAASPNSHERSSTDGPETRPEPPTVETGPVTPSATTGFDAAPTESEGGDELDADLVHRLSPPTDPAALGRLAHYEVLRLVGRGGMGRVFEAFDTALQRTVAIKVLAAHLAASAMARRRFLREARAAAALNHPNIVTVHAVGEHNGIPYLVMEYVGGGSLSTRLRAEAPLPPAEVIRLGAQVAHGLAAAHAEGLVHRDVKPANLLLDATTGRIKITDFGLAQATLDPSESAAPGQTAGTPSFLAPELLAGVVATARSDLFSLGCVLYAMVDGGSPFRGTQIMEVAKRLACDTPVPLERLDPRVPPALGALVAGLLEKSPESRQPGTAAEVAARLDALASAPITAARPGRGSRARARAVLAAVALLIVLAVVAGWLRPRTDDRRPTVPVAGGGTVRPRAAGGPLVLEDGLSWVHALAVAPDGQSALAGGGPDRDVRVWDLATERVRLRLVGHTSWLQSATFSRDGRYALTASGGSWKVVEGQRPGGNDFSVRLWDVRDGRQLRTFTGHTAPLTGVAFAPDGRMAASSSHDCTVRLWPLDRDSSHGVELVAPAEVFCVAFTPKGDRVLAGSWDRATLWDVNEARVVRSVGDHIGPVLAVAVSPDGTRGATAGDDGSIRVSALDDGHSLRVFKGHVGRINALSWSADGRHLLSGGRDGTLRLWSVDSEQPLAELRGPGEPIDSAVFFPTKWRALAGYGDGTLRIWDLPSVPGGAPARSR